MIGVVAATVWFVPVFIGGSGTVSPADEAMLHNWLHWAAIACLAAGVVAGMLGGWFAAMGNERGASLSAAGFVLAVGGLVAQFAGPGATSMAVDRGPESLQRGSVVEIGGDSREPMVAVAFDDGSTKRFSGPPAREMWERARVGQRIDVFVSEVYLVESSRSDGSVVARQARGFEISGLSLRK